MRFFRKPDPTHQAVVVLLAACNPPERLVELLSQPGQVELREALTTRGLLQALPGANLLILGEVLPAEGVSLDVLQNTLDQIQIPVISPDAFLQQPDEWLAQSRLAHQKQVQYLPPRQANLVNWAGGVGKTTLAMALCKRFCQASGLPAALLELAPGGSALHARISPHLPSFYEIATGQAKPERWEGVDLYPMNGRGLQALLDQEPERVTQALAAIRRQHTLFVVDAFPGHPLWPLLGRDDPQTCYLVVTSPRDDSILQAQQLKAELGERARLVLNMSKGLADRAESGVSVFLPYREAWAADLDHRLADPLLAQLYPGWRAK